MPENPVTRSELNAAVQTIIERIDERMAALETRMAERIDVTETKLLGAFFSYQEYSRVEMRKLKADLSNVNAGAEQRFNNIESRLIALERFMLSAKPQDPSSPT
jgi:hypothetical protein